MGEAPGGTPGPKRKGSARRAVPLEKKELATQSGSQPTNPILEGGTRTVLGRAGALSDRGLGIPCEWLEGWGCLEVWGEYHSVFA